MQSRGRGNIRDSGYIFDHQLQPPGVEGTSNRSNEDVEASPGAVEESSPGVERPKPDGSATPVVPHSICNVSAKNSAGIVGDEGIEAASVQA